MIDNIKNEEENTIYIFGSDNQNEKKKRYFKENGTLKVLPTSGFVMLKYELNSTIKLSKKGFMSIPIAIVNDRNFKSIFLNTDGWGQNDSRNYGSDFFDKTQIIDINTLYQFDKNLGYTLLEIKK